MKKVILFLVVILFATGCSVKKIEEIKDREKFAMEYNIKEENPFYYSSIEEVLEIFTKDSGIIFLGNSDGEWSRLCAKILNEAFLKTKVEKVHYLNLRITKEEEPKKYKELEGIILSQLQKKEKLQTPALFLIKSGKLESYSLDYDVIAKGNKEGFTEKEQKKLKNKYIKLIEKYQNEEE